MCVRLGIVFNKFLMVLIPETRVVGFISVCKKTGGGLPLYSIWFKQCVYLEDWLKIHKEIPKFMYIFVAIVY